MSHKKPAHKAKTKCVPRSAPIMLQPRETIARAAGLHRTLVERFSAGAAIAIDGSRVEEIDTAILQLLACAWRTGEERGLACEWAGASQALRQSASLIGVAEMLRIPDGDCKRAKHAMRRALVARMVATGHEEEVAADPAGNTELLLTADRLDEP